MHLISARSVVQIYLGSGREDLTSFLSPMISRLEAKSFLATSKVKCLLKSPVILILASSPEVIKRKDFIPGLIRVKNRVLRSYFSFEESDFNYFSFLCKGDLFFLPFGDKNSFHISMKNFNEEKILALYYEGIFINRLYLSSLRERLLISSPEEKKTYNYISYSFLWLNFQKFLFLSFFCSLLGLALSFHRSEI